MLMLNLKDEQRQSLTTWSMLGGAVAMTVCVGALVWIIRYSWPDALLASLAPKILDHLAWLAFGCLALVGVMVVAQATIAMGGKFKAKFGGAEFEAQAEPSAPITIQTTVSGVESL